MDKPEWILICNKNGAMVPEHAEAEFALLEAQIAEYTTEAFAEFFPINADLTNAEAAELGRRGVTAVLAAYDKALWRMRNLLSLIDQLEAVHSRVVSFFQRVGIRPGLNEAMRRIDFRALHERLMKERITPMETAIWDWTISLLKTEGFMGPLRVIHSNIGSYTMKRMWIPGLIGRIFYGQLFRYKRLYSHTRDLDRAPN